ncbi:MAG TPA: HAMP domain-containing sensor histidine kinase [Candidatus Nitrosotalea sp.]|nr:HAMP domain-containing sensor histidine kinase [Candidatus Nitrosotalea sp.]
MQRKVQPELNTLSALDVSMINHDAKTHLSPIKMCTEMLGSNIPGPLNEKQEKMIRTMQRCVDKLEALFSDVSDISKLGSHSLHLEKTELDVQMLLDHCTNLLRPFIAEKQVELKIESSVHGTIHADGHRIEQVLVHLVKNAIDFVPEIGGKITLTVERGQNGGMLFCVEDNGEGIKPEDFEKIFTKFYKGESKQVRRHGGSGLGLAICKGIIQEHGGKIWLDLQPNGAMFKFTIPMSS